MIVLYIVLATVFLAVAAVMNAIMDKLETEISFDNSIFCNEDKNFWCKPISAHHVPFLKWSRYRPDGWHQSKTAMIVYIAISIGFVYLAGAVSGFITWYAPLIIIAWVGIVWNLSFNTAYKLFTKK